MRPGKATRKPCRGFLPSCIRAPVVRVVKLADLAGGGFPRAVILWTSRESFGTGKMRKLSAGS